MTKKMLQKDFVESLIKKTNSKNDEAFGLIFGVSKSAVGQWKNGKSPIPLEKFLFSFGKETLDWIKQEYGLDGGTDAVRYEDLGRAAHEVFRKIKDIEEQ